MSWTTFIWSLNIGICLALAGVHLLAWFQTREERVSLAFALTAAFVAAIAVFELMAMRVETPGQYGVLLRWAHVPVAIMVCSLAWFIHLDLDYKRTWVLWAIIVWRGLILAVNFSVPVNINFSEITMIRPVPFWSEMAAVPVGVRGPWEFLIRISEIQLLLFIADASVGAWRQRLRVRALLMGTALFGSILFAALFSVMMTRGNLPMPMTISLPLMIFILTMGYEVSRDLVRARHLSRELLENQERMRLAAKTVDLGFWEWDIAKDEIWATEAGRARVGAGESDSINLDRFLRSVHPDDREATRKAVERSVDGAVDLAVEYRMVTADGRLRWIATHGYVITKGNGAPHLIRGISLDISGRKKAEIEGIQLRLEVAHLGRVITMGELSTYLAHEINQPLGAILNNATAARIQCSQCREGGEGEVVEIMDDIIRDTTRASEIVRKIRGIIKKENLAFEPLNINVLIEEVVELFSNPLTRENILIRTDLFPDLTQVRGDRVRLQQVLMNLLTNATDAMKDSSTRILTIRTTMQGPDMVVVSFSDTGSGLYEKAGDMVFQSFYTTKKEGLGMGLRICRSIIEEHGGRIGVENNPDGGATFIFTLKADSVGTA